MPIRLKVDDLGYGVLLSGIESHADARQLHRFFTDKGLTASLNPQSDGGYQILIRGISKEAFDQIARGADIEFV